MGGRAHSAAEKAGVRRVINGVWRLGLGAAYQLLRVVWFFLRPQHRGALVAVWHEGRVLLVRNSYRQWFSFPGGGLKRHELPVEAAARELQEEVGIIVQPSELRFVCEIHSDFHFQRDRCAFFELELSSSPRISVDGREVVWGDFTSLNDALSRKLLPPVRTYLLSRQPPASRTSGS